jgi:hypothetical protein
MIMVTHDQLDALEIADGIAILREGILQQCGTPQELYWNPANLFVAGSIGQARMNLLACCYAGPGPPVLPAARSRLPCSLGRFRIGGEHLSFVILNILFTPPVAVAIPMDLLWSSAGLLDSHIALILQYTVFNVPFFAWVLKSFFEDIPHDMEESAMANGATRWRAFWEIAVPLARPAILAVGLLAFIFSWNEFFFAVILTRAE